MFLLPNRFLWSLATVVLLLSSCDKSRVMEENQDVQDYQWNYSDTKVFAAEIQDTTTQYNIYVNLRHAFQFEWRNLWVNIETTFPNGKVYERRVNLLLSEPDGHWYGDCLGDNCDLQVSIQQNAFFPLPGKYTFKITQDMRVNPLPYIKSVGMRVEQATK